MSFVNENTYSIMNLQGVYWGTVSVPQFVWVSGGDHGYKWSGSMEGLELLEDLNDCCLLNTLRAGDADLRF